MQSLWEKLPYGAEGGISTEGDIVRTTVDGVALEVLWDEITQALSVWNAQRSAIGSIICRQTVNKADAIPQAMAEETFNIASEFGEPESLSAGSVILLGNSFHDFDRATRFSYRFLRDSTAEQIRNVTNEVLAMDNALTNGLIWKRLFNPATEVNEVGITCYGLWNGDMAPPSHLGKTFPANHSHYLVSQGTVIDSGDLETAITGVQEHGYGVDPGNQLYLFVNPVEADEVAKFKAGEENNNDAVANYSFIPSSGAPAYIQPGNIVGDVAPAEVNGLKLEGSYGPLWVHRSQYVPAGYFAVVASAGPNSDRNPVSFRQHINPAYQGLRTIEGPKPAYPIQESFFTRGCGTGIRHRGAAFVTQIKASGSYDAPVIPGLPLGF